MIWGDTSLPDGACSNKPGSADVEMWNQEDFVSVDETDDTSKCTGGEAGTEGLVHRRLDPRGGTSNHEPVSGQVATFV